MDRRFSLSKILLPCAMAVAMVFSALPVFAQPAAGPIRGMATIDLGGTNISVNYGRPSLKGRNMIAEAKAGMVWRLGMNEATVLRTSSDLYTCCGVIKAGAYSLWAKKVGDNKWEMAFNSQTGQWGTMHDPTKDILSVPMTVENSKASVEKFTITIVKTAKGGEIRCAWGTQVLVMEFSTKV